MVSIKNICKGCVGSDDTYTDRGKIVTSCDCTISIGQRCFESNKLDLIKNSYNELDINTKHSSYVKFIIEADMEIAKMHSMRSNTVYDLHMSHIEFPMEMYKKIDLLFTKWGSWYSRTIITLKTLLISGHYCPNFTDFILSSIHDYYEAGDKSVRCEVSDRLNDVVKRYFNEMSIPNHNGEFIEALRYIGVCLNSIYKIMIIQYANEYQLEQGRNVLYYSSDFRTVGLDMEKSIVEFRAKQLIEKYGNFELRYVNSLNMSNEDGQKLIRSVFGDYKENITNYDSY